MKILFELFCIYFRVGSWGLYGMGFNWSTDKKYKRFKFLLPPKFWRMMMCKFGKHDFDLCYSGPDCSGVVCMDCTLESHSKLDKKTGKITTRQWYGKKAANGQVYKVKEIIK